MTQEDIMQLLDKHPGTYMSVNEIIQKLEKQIGKRSVFNALSKIAKTPGYEAELFFDRSNRTSTNALTKYRATKEE